MAQAYRVYANPDEIGESTETVAQTLRTRYQGRQTSEETDLTLRTFPPRDGEASAGLDSQTDTDADVQAESDGTTHRYGLYRYDAENHPEEIANSLNGQLLGDAEWAVIDYHRCSHGEPDRQQCAPWQRIIARGPVPDSVPSAGIELWDGDR